MILFVWDECHAETLGDVSAIHHNTPIRVGQLDIPTTIINIHAYHLADFAVTPSTVLLRPGVAPPIIQIAATNNLDFGSADITLLHCEPATFAEDIEFTTVTKAPGVVSIHASVLPGIWQKSPLPSDAYLEILIKGCDKPLRVMARSEKNATLAI